MKTPSQQDIEDILENRVWEDRNGLTPPPFSRDYDGTPDAMAVGPTDRVWRGLTPAEALARSEHRDYPAADCYEEIPQLPGWVWALFASVTTFGAAFVGWLIGN